MFSFTAKKKVKQLWRSTLIRQRPIKVLIVRNDGLGDFILTLPLFSGIKKQCEDVQVYALVNESLTSLTNILEDVDGAICDPGILLKRHRNKYSKQELKLKRKQLLAEIQAHNFDLAILPYSEKESAKVIKQAGIKLRAGSGRRSYSRLFNLKNFETRRASGKSEYELNQNYLAIIKLTNQYIAPKVISAKNKTITNDTSKTQEVQVQKKIIIHPYKRSGTALTWAMENYIALTKQLLQEGHRVTIIGDTQDEPILQKRFKRLKKKKDNLKITTEQSLRDLVFLIQDANLYIGNSSGPLHIAGLTQTPHIAFYPKDKVSSAIRWQTLPAINMQSTLLSPINNMKCIQCIGEKCSFYNCVHSIELSKVMKEVNRLLKN